HNPAATTCLRPPGSYPNLTPHPQLSWRYRLVVRTGGSQPSNRGSTPRSATTSGPAFAGLFCYSLIPMPELIQIENPEDPGSLRPALRPLEVSAVEEDGEQLLVLADPLHLLEDAVVLPAAYLPLLEILDGSRTVDQLSEQLVKETGDLRTGTFLRTLVRRLDDMMLLDSPRFRGAWRKMIEDYRNAPTRAAAFAGSSYPEEPAETREFLG